jgi:diguanylate cyclase (GGDEF)-like protein
LIPQRRRSAAAAPVDHFKEDNDTFGHLAGDNCLRQVGSTLSTTLRRQSDYVARYGGEEFVVMLPACKATAGLVLAQSLRSAIETLDAF